MGANIIIIILLLGVLVEVHSLRLALREVKEKIEKIEKN